MKKIANFNTYSQKINSSRTALLETKKKFIIKQYIKNEEKNHNIFGREKNTEITNYKIPYQNLSNRNDYTSKSVLRTSYTKNKIDTNEDENKIKLKNSSTKTSVASAKKNTLHSNYQKGFVSKKMIDKVYDNIDDSINKDDINDLSMRSALYYRKGYISTKNSLLTAKKVYFISNNIKNNVSERKKIKHNQDINKKQVYYIVRNAEKIKAVNISSSLEKEIKTRKINLYKNYTLKNLVNEQLEKKVQSVKANYNYIGDSSVEATKMAVDKTYEASKSIQFATTKIKYIKEKATISEKNKNPVKSTIKKSELKNKIDKKEQAKRFYARELKRVEYFKLNQSARINSISNTFSNLFSTEGLKALGIKLIVPLSLIFFVVLFFNFMSMGNASVIVPYKVIAAEKNIILDYKNFISQLDSDLEEKISDIRSKAREDYDDIEIHIFSENGKIETNFKEFLALNSVIYEQNLKFSEKEKGKMIKFYNMMNTINTRTEYYHCDCNPKPCGRRFHIRLHIEVTCKSVEDIIDDIELNDFQKEWFRELMLFDLEDLYPGNGFEPEGGISGFSGLTPVEISTILSKLPETGVKREAIVNNAVSLVGKVKYFWGGKSSAGWNDSWGKPREVTAPGTSDYGKSIPYGLDCSGFVDWAYKTSGINVLGAGGTAYQWGQSYGIPKGSARPGDLVFKNPPNSAGINHVGIYLGKDKSNGKELFVHCSYDKGVTIDSWSGFKYYRRVKVKLDE